MSATLGEFTVLGVLGTGGSGIVYEAQWDKRTVALKVLHDHLVASVRERAQWVAEAQRLQALAHPSIVKVLACGELPDGRPYLAMEKLDGDTLATRIAKRGAIAIADALPLFDELCGAVSAMHAKGLVHRDLKPENVVVCDGHAVLLDFGIAKELDAPASTTTQDGGVRGTPAYMAPERFFGQPASVATDVYELAVILYVMLAGRLPWDDHADPEARLSPRSLVDVAGIDDALDQEIRRAMSTRAQNRPASAAALAVAISTVASEGSKSAASTARLGKAIEDRDADDDARGRVTEGPGPRPAPRRDIDERTLDEHPTPMAWGGNAAPKPRSKRAVLVAGGAVAVAVLGVGAWRIAASSGGEGTSTTAPSGITAEAIGGSGVPGSSLLPSGEPDPWGATGETVADAPPAPIAKLPPTEPAATAAEYRAEIAAAIPKLPKDAQVVFTALVGDLKGSKLAPLLDKLGTHPQLATLDALMPICTKELIASAEWLVAGFSDVTGEPNGAVIVRGRWTKPAVLACFEQTSAPAKLDFAEKITLDFVDDHTAILAIRDPDAKPVRTSGNLARLVATLPAHRSAGFAALGGVIEWGDPVPKGSDITGWVRFEPTDDAALDVTIDAHAVKPAEDLAAHVLAELSEVFAGKPLLGIITTTRTGTTVRISGRVTSVLLGLVVSAVP